MKNAGDDASSGESEAASSKQERLPSWIAVGKRAHWWSESQQKNMSVIITKVDHKKNLVIATFEVDQKVWKSVPFTKIGKRDCPLRNPDGEASKKDESSASKKKRKDPKDGSVTPDWRTNMKVINDQRAKREQAVIEEKRKEEEKIKEQKKRQDLVAAERRKVEQAFEKRKAEAEAQKLKEEEEWRKNLLKRRAEEAAEEEVRQKEKEERRKKRKEEKEAKDKALGIVKKPKTEAKLEAKAQGGPQLVPPRADLPDALADQAAQQRAMVLAGLQMFSGAGQMPAAMMQMMAAQAQGLGDMSGASSGFGGAGLGVGAAGAWGGQVQPGMLAGVGAAPVPPGMGSAGQGAAQWGGQWGNMAHAWGPGGQGQFQAPWGSG